MSPESGQFRDLVDIPRIAEWTGINSKTLSQWANDRGKLPAVSDRARNGKRFHWPTVRPLLAVASEGHEGRVPPSEWPK